MNWLKKQKSKTKESQLYGRRHRAANSARNIPPPPPSVKTPQSPKHNRAQSDTAVTSPRTRCLSPAEKRHNVLAMCNDFVQSQQTLTELNLNSDDREAVFAPTRKSTNSFAAHLNEFGNTNDLDNILFDTDDDAPKKIKKKTKRKPKGSFATHLTEFGNKNDLDDILLAIDDDNVSMKKKKKKGSFATHLSEFVDNTAGGLDAVVNDIDSDIYKNGQQEKQTRRRHNETAVALSPKDSYQQRLDQFARNQRHRAGTISKLKEEIAHSPRGYSMSKEVLSPSMAKIKNKYKKRPNIYKPAFSFNDTKENETPLSSAASFTSSSSSFTTCASMASNTFKDQKLVINKKKSVDYGLEDWHKYLLSIHEYLRQNVQYFDIIKDDLSHTTTTKHHERERLLITKMKHWIERYGIAAMTSYSEVYQLKTQLIKSHEEANHLEEESVQLTQKVFGLEHKVQTLNEGSKRQESDMEILHRAIQSYKRDIEQLKDMKDIKRGNRTPPPPSSEPHHMPVLQLSSSAHTVSPPPPPPPRTQARSPSPIPLKQSYSDNILEVEPFDLDRQSSHPQAATAKDCRLKPNKPALRQGRHSQPNMKLKKDVNGNKSEFVYVQKNELLTHNEYLITQVRLLNNSKSELETELVKLKKAVSDHGIKEPDIFAEKNSSLTPKFKAKKRKSLITFGRKSNNKEINEQLQNLINEMSQQKYIWASEKNKLKEEIVRLQQQIKSMQKTGKSHRILDSDDINTLKAGKEAMKRAEEQKKTPGWQRGSFGDRLNNFAVDEACSMDDVLAAITHDTKDVDRELTETELSGLEFIGDEKGAHANSAHDIIVTAEIDEYENSDDGWVSSEGGDIENNVPESVTSNFALSQSTTQSIATSSVSTTAAYRVPAKITKVMIPKEAHSLKQGRLNGILSKFYDKKQTTQPKKAVPPPPPSNNNAAAATTVIANVKRTKRRFFHPTKHGFLCIDKSKLWQRDNSKPKVYAAIDGLPSSTNLNRSEPNWKKRKDNDILVPFFCLFKNKTEYENLCSLTAHKSVRDILFQKKFAEHCSAFIRLDTALVHWDLSVLLKELKIEDNYDNGGANLNCKLFIASNVDRNKKYIEIHSFMTNDETSRNQWFSAIQGMMNKRRVSAHRRSVHGNTHQNPSSGRYKMKLF